MHVALKRLNPRQLAPFKQTRTVFVVGSDPNLTGAVIEEPGLSLAGQVSRMDMFLSVVRECQSDDILFEAGVLEGWDLRRLFAQLRLMLPEARFAAAFLRDGAQARDLARQGEDIGVTVLISRTGRWREVVGRLVSGPRFFSTPGILPFPTVERKGRSGLDRPSGDGVARWLSPRNIFTKTGASEEVRETSAGGYRAIAQEEAPVTPQVVSVYSPKGGVGKTFLITNLAVAVARLRRYKVALVDLDLHSSDVGVHLDLIGGPTIVDLLPFVKDLDRATLKRFMVDHRPSGLSVLLGPTRPELSELVKPETVKRIIEILKTEYAFVFIDSPPDASSDLIYDCLEGSNRVVLVTTLDVASLRQTKVAIDVLEKLKFPVSERVVLAVNQFHDGAPLTLNQVESFLGFPVRATVRDDRKAVEDSVFAGKPLLGMGFRSEMIEDLLNLAAAVCSEVGKSVPRQSGLAAWFGRLGRAKQG